jgi:HK97 family phage prohead protease
MSELNLKYKASEFSLKEDGEDIIIEGWANPKTIDSIGDLMFPEGAKTDRYKKNPIVLFNHDRTLPVGKALEYKALPEGFWIKAILANSIIPQVKFVRDLVRQGILKMFSIGFNPIKEKQGPNGTNEIVEWELHEVSLVPLPMNADAEFSLVKNLAEKHNIKIDNIIYKSLGMKGESMADNPMGKKPKLDAEGKPMLDEAGNPIYEDEIPEDKGCGDNKPEDKPQKTDDEIKADAFQECVSSKIPTLIKEGKTQDEAVAIAISMCNTEGKCSLVPNEKQLAEFKKQAEMIPTNSVNIDQPTPIEDSSPILTKLDALIEANNRIAGLLETIAQNMHNKPSESQNPSQPMGNMPVSEEMAAKTLEKAGKLLENMNLKLKELGI